MRSLILKVLIVIYLLRMILLKESSLSSTTSFSPTLKEMVCFLFFRLISPLMVLRMFHLRYLNDSMHLPTTSPHIASWLNPLTIVSGTGTLFPVYVLLAEPQEDYLVP